MASSSTVAVRTIEPRACRRLAETLPSGDHAQHRIPGRDDRRRRRQRPRPRSLPVGRRPPGPGADPPAGRLVRGGGAPAPVDRRRAPRDVHRPRRTGGEGSGGGDSAERRGGALHAGLHLSQGAPRSRTAFASGPRGLRRHDLRPGGLQLDGRRDHAPARARQRHYFRRWLDPVDLPGGRVRQDRRDLRLQGGQRRRRLAPRPLRRPQRRLPRPDLRAVARPGCLPPVRQLPLPDPVGRQSDHPPLALSGPLSPLRRPLADARTTSPFSTATSTSSPPTSCAISTPTTRRSATACAGTSRTATSATCSTT